VYPSLTPVKDKEVVILGSSMHCKSFSAALYSVLRTMIDDLGSQTFNVVIFGMDTAAPSNGRLEHGCASSLESPGVEDSELVQPVVARVVVRGAVNAKASDFGAMEVLCGASIGCTDPYLVHQALQRRLAL
jgi:hypothetical protein